MEQIQTYHGSFEYVHSVTLGDVLIASAVLLHLSFGVIRWLMDSIWGRRR